MRNSPGVPRDGRPRLDGLVENRPDRLPVRADHALQVGGANAQRIVQPPRGGDRAVTGPELKRPQGEPGGIQLPFTSRADRTLRGPFRWFAQRTDDVGTDQIEAEGSSRLAGFWTDVDEHLELPAEVVNRPSGPAGEGLVDRREITREVRLDRHPRDGPVEPETRSPSPRMTTVSFGSRISRAPRGRVRLRPIESASPRDRGLRRARDGLTPR